MGTFLARKMHYFMVTMEELNFTKAAEKLCITRSPLSKVICELEENLGGKLFKRTYSTLQPTELAYEYYSKCKNIYDELINMESEIRFRDPNPVYTLIFDISVPELLYRTIIMGLSAENVNVAHQRKIVNYEDMNKILSSRDNCIFSLREINNSMWDYADKWKGDDIVLIAPKGTGLEPRSFSMFVWNDSLLDYTKKKFLNIINKPNTDITFLPHNFDLSTLCYNIHIGHGCALMTRKLACLYKIDGVEIQETKNNALNIYFYHAKNGKTDGTHSRIKKVINKFI